MKNYGKIEYLIQICNGPKNEWKYQNTNKSNKAVQIRKYAEWLSVASESHKDIKKMNQMIDSKQGYQNPKSILFLIIPVYIFKAIITHH